MSLNRVILTGRLTGDPEVRATGSGLMVASFSIAVNEYVKGEEQTSFFNVTGFGKTAEILRDRAQKGTLVGLDGVLRQNRWETREGDKRSRVEIIAQRIQLFDRQKNGGSSAPASEGKENYDIPPNDDFLSGDEDIPF
jgi:single-strand DNA-binding protein